MNKVQLIGRLVRDPEVRYSQGAQPMAIARYTLACDRKILKNGQREADFISCKAFGKSAEFAEKHFKKGQRVGICGHIHVESWDGNDGKKHWSMEVIVDEQEFADAARNAGGEADFAKQSIDHDGIRNDNSAPAAAPAQAPSENGFYPTDDADDSDLPW